MGLSGMSGMACQSMFRMPFWQFLAILMPHVQITQTRMPNLPETSELPVINAVLEVYGRRPETANPGTVFLRFPGFRWP